MRGNMIKVINNHSSKKLTKIKMNKITSNNKNLIMMKNSSNNKILMKIRMTNQLNNLLLFQQRRFNQHSMINNGINKILHKYPINHDRNIKKK